jgi:branched-chain amino acid transport system ATP-binding protein
VKEEILAIKELSVAYGKAEAVRNVSLTVRRGNIVTVIGANGAGKSTLLNAAMGILPCMGEIVFEGRVLGDSLVEERVADGICLVPEQRALFADMTVEDNLRLGAYRLGSAAIPDGIDEAFTRFPRLKERRRQKAGTLSGGERQMLAMGRALMSRPRLLMLDEPSLGLAPLFVREIFHIVTDLRQTGVSVLLVEQNARAALDVADYGYVMELGQVTLHGPAARLAHDDKVIASYLGLGTERIVNATS